MAHFNYVKPGGIWSLFSLLTSGIMSTIDTMLYKCINGDEGGTWAPHLPGSPVPTPIVIGGDGLTVYGQLTATDVVTMTVTGTLTIDQFAFLTADAGSFVTLGGLTSLTGIMESTGSGQFKVSNVGGIEVLNGGEVDFDSGGAWRLKGGSTGYMDPGSIISMSGTGLFSSAVINVGAYGFINFVGNNSIAFWGSGAKGWFEAGSTLQVDGITSFTGGSSTNVDGSSNSNKAAWLWGGFSTQTLIAGAVVTDAGTHTNLQGWTWTGSSASIIVTANSTLDVTTSGFATFFGSTQLNGLTTLGMGQPTPSGALAPNQLVPTLLVKAWCLLTIEPSNQITVDDGANIADVNVGPDNNLYVTFATQFANVDYVVWGNFYNSEDASGTPVSAVAVRMAGPTKTMCGLRFVETSGPGFAGMTGGGTILNMNLMTGIIMLMFIGRQ